MSKPIRLRFITIFCVLVGFIEIAIIGTWRFQGLLTEDDFPTHIMLLWPIGLVVLIPTTIWVVTQPRAKKCAERVGAAMLLFVLIPVLSAMLISYFFYR